MTITRAMVPVLLCFDVEHEDGATEEQVAERIRELVIRNLGDIGEEADKVSFAFDDEHGKDLDGAIYPSDYPWCDTMAHARPDWECSKPADAFCETCGVRNIGRYQDLLEDAIRNSLVPGELQLCARCVLRKKIISLSTLPGETEPREPQIDPVADDRKRWREAEDLLMRLAVRRRRVQP